MTTTKAKNDTTSVTAAIMSVNVDKDKYAKPAAKPTDKPVAKPKVEPTGKSASKENLKAVPAPAKTGDKKEETTVTMSTDAFSKEILTEYQRRTKAIKSSINKIDSSFESIAFNLHWINTKQAFKADGYPTIVEYAAEKFGYQKSTCYSLIAVVDRFAKRDEKGALTESLDDRVKGYSVSKLSLMVNLTESEIASLKPTMSVREIKKFVKGLEGKALPELSEGDGEIPEGEEEDSGTEDSNVIDVESTVISDVLIKCKGKEDFDAKAGKISEYVARVFKQHPDAVIEVSYSLPSKKEKE